MTAKKPTKRAARKVPARRVGRPTAKNTRVGTVAKAARRKVAAPSGARKRNPAVKPKAKPRKRNPAARSKYFVVNGPEAGFSKLDDAKAYAQRFANKYGVTLHIVPVTK
jgi:hypothetical protein